MCWCHQVEVMTFFLLEIHHHICQAFRPDAVTQPSLTQGEILTVGAARLAIAEEDGACSSRATDGRFLPAVNIPRGDYCFRARPAHACLARDTIAAAILRADGTATQNLPGGSGAFCQFACFIKIEIAGIKHIDLFFRRLFCCLLRLRPFETAM